MLIHQCSSCKKLDDRLYSEAADLPALPKGWGRLTLRLPDENTARVYDLCAECLSMPMTFGKFEFRMDRRNGGR